MGYLIKAPLGLAMFFGGIVLFNVKLVSLLETGTCASGNTPYQISQPCPEGTGTDILLLTAGIIAGLIGAAIFAFRGDPPWHRDGRRTWSSRFSFGLFAWGAFFAGTGATSLIASLTNEAIQESSGGELGGIIVGATFLLMGVPALLIALWGFISRLGSRDERPAAAMAGAKPLSGGDSSRSRWVSAFQRATIAGSGGPTAPPGWSWKEPGEAAGSMDKIKKIERLQKLRESGALTDAEFQREKAKVLSEG